MAPHRVPFVRSHLELSYIRIELRALKFALGFDIPDLHMPDLLDLAVQIVEMWNGGQPWWTVVSELATVVGRYLVELVTGTYTALRAAMASPAGQAAIHAAVTLVKYVYATLTEIFSPVAKSFLGWLKAHLTAWLREILIDAQNPPGGHNSTSLNQTAINLNASDQSVNQTVNQSVNQTVVNSVAAEIESTSITTRLSPVRGILYGLALVLFFLGGWGFALFYAGLKGKTVGDAKHHAKKQPAEHKQPAQSEAETRSTLPRWPPQWPPRPVNAPSRQAAAPACIRASCLDRQ
jgi:hypothetical protein